MFNTSSLFWLVSKSPLRKSCERDDLNGLFEDILLNSGWGNGYIVIHKDLLDLHDIKSIKNLYVHCGFTYENDSHYGDNNFYVFGFDTAHYGDTLKQWPKEKVEEETQRLFNNVKYYLTAKYTENKAMILLIMKLTDEESIIHMCKTRVKSNFTYALKNKETHLIGE
jgi:hypothetical protein